MNNKPTWIIQTLRTHDGYPNWTSYCIRSAASNVHIATVGDVDRFYEDKTLQHAQLIAAAPELLKACKRMLPWIVKMIADGGHLAAVAPNDAIGAMQQAQAAIDSATAALEAKAGVA